MANKEKCEGCPVLIRMLKHKQTGKFAPIEVEPAGDGNIFVQGNFYRMATKKEIGQAKFIGKPLYRNHFWKCPKAKSFAKGK